ncbi:MAG: dihydropyrimidine dehydrogenase, partial [Mesorhizobium sp.]
MATGHFIEGIAGGRLSSEQYADNFSDLHPPLDHHEALVEADRCYFCYDAPCMNACPTSIDIPLFIRQIATGNPLGSAKTIFDQNILGGMCARVCPTETLCEEVCVREVAEGKPVQIGRLQRYATAAAHRLARHGHDVTILEARPKAGGLNEYGIAAYKSVDDFAQVEVDYVTSIGGIDIQNGKALGRDFQLSDLIRNYDAVFLGLGLGGINALRADGEEADGVANAVEFIAEVRQASDL